ncbi:MAG TPA: DNA polymerase III subunit gamma and tau, partial [Mycobacteriales bacterium]|nr:DNA polymerase III subunit gamma and tau [Mycobacteriales bacterium]
MALYRKYRPSTLAEVKGQEHVTGPLRQALLNGKVHHAYLFSGPRGCGKTSSARILARSLNCEQGPTPDPCGECDSCVALAPNGAGTLDVIEIDAASNNGVDDARDLRERAFYAPVASRYKIYIIDEAHMVTSAAFNALLKLVEEPPEFLRFVFATTEPEKVLGTIRSRTHHYPFRLMPRAELTALLEEIVVKEGVAFDPAVMPLVVRAAAGSARDGLSILDQVLAGSGPEGVTREGAAQLLGVTPDTLLEDVIDALAARDGAAVFAAVDQVMESGLSPRRFVEDVLQRLRDLVVLAAVPDAVDKQLLDVPEGQLPAMVRQAQAVGAAGLSRAADLFHDGLTELKGTTAPRLLLELLCARVLLPGASTDEAALLARLERLERRFDIAGPSAAPLAEAPARPAAPVTAAPPPAPRAEQRPAPTAEPVARPSWPEAATPGGTPDAAPETAADPEPPPPGGLDATALRRSW